MKDDHTFPFVHRHKTLVANIAKPDYRSSPGRIEPQRTSDISAQTLAHLLYDNLTRCLSNGEIILSQAQTYEVSDDGKAYIFTLRENHWSDGSLVRAQDFENTWKYLLRPDIECPSSYFFFFIKNAKKAKEGKISPDQIGVKSLSDSRLRIVLEKPISFILDLLACYVFAPLHPSSIEGFYPNPDSTYYPLISNGPFKLCHWSPNVELVMDKNTHYYRAKEIYLERIRLNYLVNDLRVVDHFLQRNIDVMVKRFRILFKHEAIKHLVSSKELLSDQLTDTCCCIFNCKNPIFKHKKLRRAFSMGIDRPKVLQRLTVMGEQAATGLLSPIYRGNEESTNFSKFDLLEARKLFQEVLKEEKISQKTFSSQLMLFFPHSEFYFNLAEDLKECWEFIFDMKITTEPLTLDEMTKRMAERDFSMAILSWNSYYFHPISMLERFRTKNDAKNYCQWNTKEFTELLQQASCAKTQKKSWEFCKQADDIIKEEAPIAPIFHACYGTLIQPYVKNFKVSPMGVVNFDEITFDEELLVQRPIPEHPLAKELIVMLKQSIREPLKKMGWYGVNFTSPYHDYLSSMRFPDP